MRECDDAEGLLGGGLPVGEEPGRLAGLCQAGGPELTAAGGRHLVREKPAKTYEAGLNERVVIVVADSVEQAIALTTHRPTRRR